jgi:Concanavalin A-like lectin/glucanases superfamily
MILDIAGERLIGNLPTGGPVIDIAIDPAGKKLFLAMGKCGFNRLSLDTGTVTRISDRVCPVNVAIDPQGKRLYVAYQCSGPGGHPGHDSVEVFDAETETSLGIVSGLPMVGGPVSISPDDRLAMLDGSDACESQYYDHSGCSSAPSRVFHLLRAADRRILHTFNYPTRNGRVYFVDNSRFLMLGHSISVVDAAKYAVLERLDLGDDQALSAVLKRDRSRLWVGVKSPPGLLEFDLESSSCAAQEANPAMFFPADGSFEDASDANILNSHGRVSFAPGRIGQAFFLDGKSYLSADSTGYYKLDRHNFSISMYVKFASTQGDAALIDWKATAPERGIRMLKSADNRIVFQIWPGQSPMTSVSTIAPNTWYHVAVTKTDDLVTLFVNGKREASDKPPPRWPGYDAPLLLGAYDPGRSSLHGWLDEIAFYNRGLTDGEIENLYRQRAAGMCGPD